MKADFLKDKKLIIFDMDGTLINSLDVWNEVDVRVVNQIRNDGLSGRENMQELRDEVLRNNATSPNPYVDYCNFLKERYKSSYTNEEVYALRYEIAFDMLEKEVDFKPYAHLFIKELKERGYLLAIASTGQNRCMAIYREKNKNIIDKARLDEYFSVIFARDDCHEIKPHPEIFLKVLSTLGIKAEDAFIFEDSLVGVEASKRAGIECCAVYDKHNDHDREKINAIADYNIKSFGELL